LKSTSERAPRIREQWILDHNDVEELSKYLLNMERAFE
jgi:hypothetical protein